MSRWRADPFGVACLQGKAGCARWLPSPSPDQFERKGVAVAEPRIPTRCDHCGQVDDHPKANIGSLNTGLVTTKHFDCLSFDEEQMERDSAQARGSGPKVSAIIDAAKSGVHGNELLELIQGGELPQAEGLHEQWQREIDELEQGVGVSNV